MAKEEKQENTTKKNEQSTQVNTSLINKSALLNFEKLAISDESDIFIPTIDKTSTVRGSMKYSVESDHREDYTKDKKIFDGIILRIPAVFSENNSNPQNMISNFETHERQFIYKVRVPEIDGPFLERPKTFDETPKDKGIISTYADFRAPSDLILRVGDRVKVTYGDLLNHKLGRILARVPENIQDRVQVQVQVQSGGGIDGAFNSSGETPTYPGNTPEEQKLNSLEPPMREKVVLFLSKARAAGYNIFITDARRTMAEQAKKYSYGRTDMSQGIISNAPAGSSPHNYGMAIDIAFKGPETYPKQRSTWEAVAAIGKSVGLRWGGDWVKFNDQPHFELYPQWLKFWRDWKKGKIKIP